MDALVYKHNPELKKNWIVLKMLSLRSTVSVVHVLLPLLLLVTLLMVGLFIFIKITGMLYRSFVLSLGNNVDNG